MGKPDLPAIAIIMGDPNGIGPEITLKCLKEAEIYQLCRPFVIGDLNCLIAAASLAGWQPEFESIDDVIEFDSRPGTISVLDMANIAPDSVRFGVVDVRLGKASVEYMEKSLELFTDGKILGVAAAPMCKEAMRRAGYQFEDEIEFYAKHTGTENFAVVGLLGNIWVVRVTSHVPFSEIPQLITKENVFSKILLGYDTLRQVGITEPRIAVAALNVHGGEGGLYGDDEIRAIRPAVEEAGKCGINVIGPLPADTIFVRAQRGDFDLVVSMYHDQANIAIKLMAFARGVTVGGGLPLVYTTTAHGTAFDIAGKGVADPGSLIAAVKAAAKMVRGRAAVA